MDEWAADALNTRRLLLPTKIGRHAFGERRCMLGGNAEFHPVSAEPVVADSVVMAYQRDRAKIAVSAMD